MRGLTLLLLGTVASGCYAASTSQDGGAGEEIPDGGEFEDEMPDDLPAGECREGVDVGDCEAAESSGGVDASPAADEPACQTSEDCTGAGGCVASYEDGARGGFTCRFSCVPTLDESAWCSDDASCCDTDARCTARGYCVVSSEPERSGPTHEADPSFSDEMPDDLPAGGGQPSGGFEDSQ